MLSLFPSLLTYSGFAPFLLRLILGSVFAFWGYEKVRSKDNKTRLIAIFKFIIAIMLILGYMTQLAALLASIILGVYIAYKIINKSFLNNGINYYLVLFVISLSILISGSGFMAFDLPL